MLFKIPFCSSPSFPLVGVHADPALKIPESRTAIRWTALVTSLVTFGVSLWVLALFDPATMQIHNCEIRLPWFPKRESHQIFTSAWTGSVY